MDSTTMSIFFMFSNFQVNGKPFTVEIIDSVKNYVDLMKEIFDFDKLKSFVAGKPIKMRIDSMNGGNVAWPVDESIDFSFSMH